MTEEEIYGQKLQSLDYTWLIFGRNEEGRSFFNNNYGIIIVKYQFGTGRLDGILRLSSSFGAFKNVEFEGF
jgi:hypothetical protein